ncbi:MAG: polyphosphate polymerase domain-containing protein [Oscillospiraceae bacterium]
MRFSAGGFHLPPKIETDRKMRHELKFMIDEGTYRILRGRLRPLTMPDPHSADGEYRVTSVYFDDIFGTAYRDKVNGLETRRKFRIRSYGLDPSLITLEAKHKDSSYVSKVTRRLTREQYEMLLRGDCSFMYDCADSACAFGEFYRSDCITALKPKIIVDYQREAYIYPYGNVRITFDKKLSTCYNTVDMFAENAFFSRIFDREIILEVKFDSYIPASIQDSLHGLNAATESVSKFIICCDAAESRIFSHSALGMSLNTEVNNAF